MEKYKCKICNVVKDENRFSVAQHGRRKKGFQMNCIECGVHATKKAIASKNSSVIEKRVLMP